MCQVMKQNAESVGSALAGLVSLILYQEAQSDSIYGDVLLKPYKKRLKYCSASVRQSLGSFL